MTESSRSLAPRRIGRLLAPALLLATMAILPSCATKHLLRWNAGKPNYYGQPADRDREIVRVTGTIAGFPVAVVWDVVTFPVQWLWGFDPYGDTFREREELEAEEREMEQQGAAN
jgi:hypothetical protein